MTEVVKEQAAKLAAKGGFRCLIPDLYKGKVGVDAEEASHLMGALDFNAAVVELQAAVAWLKAEGSPQVCTCCQTPSVRGRVPVRLLRTGHSATPSSNHNHNHNPHHPLGVQYLS